MIGTHWFQWLDQPATGRNDGENYNIGFVDVTDQPYAELVDGRQGDARAPARRPRRKNPTVRQAPQGLRTHHR